MSYSVLTHFGMQSTSANTVDSGNIDTTGADLLLGVVAFYEGVTSGASVFDDYGNTWNYRTLYKSTNRTVVIAWCKPATVGAFHVFHAGQASQYPTACFLVLSGSAATPYDTENGNFTNSGTTLQTGSVTPSEDNEIVIAGVSGSATSGSVPSIDAGFTVTESYIGTANAVAGGLAYKIQTTAAAVNPTWTLPSGEIAAAIATFKGPGGGGGSTFGPIVDGGSLLRGIVYGGRLVG